MVGIVLNKIDIMPWSEFVLLFFVFLCVFFTVTHLFFWMFRAWVNK